MLDVVFCGCLRWVCMCVYFTTHYILSLFVSPDTYTSTMTTVSCSSRLFGHHICYLSWQSWITLSVIGIGVGPIHNWNCFIKFRKNGTLKFPFYLWNIENDSCHIWFCPPQSLTFEGRSFCIGAGDSYHFQNVEV